MTRQTTLDIRPDQVRPHETRADPANSTSADSSSQPDPSDPVPSTSESNILWKPEYDNNFFIADQIQMMEEEEEGKRKKKSVRFGDTEILGDKETDDRAEWLSVYDKSEMMADSDYQEEIGDASTDSDDATARARDDVGKDRETTADKEVENPTPSVESPKSKMSFESVRLRNLTLETGEDLCGSTSSSSSDDDKIGDLSDDEVAEKQKKKEWKNTTDKTVVPNASLVTDQPSTSSSVPSPSLEKRGPETDELCGSTSSSSSDDDKIGDLSDDEVAEKHIKQIKEKLKKFTEKSEVPNASSVGAQASTSSSVLSSNPGNGTPETREELCSPPSISSSRSASYTNDCTNTYVDAIKKSDEEAAARQNEELKNRKAKEEELTSSGSGSSSSSSGWEDYDPKEEERKSAKKAQEWLNKSTELARTPSPDEQFADSSGSDCTENANIVIKREEAREEREKLVMPVYDNKYDPSTDDEAPKAPADESEKSREMAVSKPDAEKYSSSSDDEKTTKAKTPMVEGGKVPEMPFVFESSSSSDDQKVERKLEAIKQAEERREDFYRNAGRMRFKGSATLVKVEKIDDKYDDSSSCPEEEVEEKEVKTSTESKIERETVQLDLADESTSSWKRDMTEEFNKIIDASGTTSPTSPSTSQPPRPISPPEKSPRDQMKDIMSKRVDEELKKVSSEKQLARARRKQFYRKRNQSSSSSDDENFFVMPARAKGDFPIDEINTPHSPSIGLSKDEIDRKAEIEESEKERILQNARAELDNPRDRKVNERVDQVKEEADKVIQDMMNMLNAVDETAVNVNQDIGEEKLTSETESDTESDEADQVEFDTSDSDKEVAGPTTAKASEATAAQDSTNEALITDKPADEGNAEEPKVNGGASKVDNYVIQHQPEPDLMDRLNRLLGRTMDEIKSADAILEEHQSRMEQTERRIAGEEKAKKEEEKKEVEKETGGFFDTALRMAGEEEATEPEQEKTPKEPSSDEIQDEDDNFYNAEDEERNGYMSDTEDEVQFTPGRKDYSFSESDLESARRAAPFHVEDDDVDEEDLLKRKEELPALHDPREDDDRYSDHDSSVSTATYSSSDSEEERKNEPVGRSYARKAASSTSESSSDHSSSAWSADEAKPAEKFKLDPTPTTDFDETKEIRTRAWADEQLKVKQEDEVTVVPKVEVEVKEYANKGPSSDPFVQPFKPTPPKQRPLSATQPVKRTSTGPRRIRPMSAQNSASVQPIPLRQYNLDFNQSSDRHRPRGRRVSGALYKYEPIDNDARLRQKFNELIEIVEGDSMPIAVGRPARTGVFSPRAAQKSPRERSKSSESEPSRKRTSPRSRKPEKQDETIDPESLSKELDLKYRELEALLAKTGGNDAQSHRLIQRQLHQAIVLTQCRKNTAEPRSKMEGYQYNLPPRPNAIPDRDDPRSRSFSPTDHHLRNSDNPMVKDWLKHKERCLRIQRAEERQKRKEEKKKQKVDINEKEEKFKESMEKVDEWMKKKRKEGRRLLRYRNNKENFVNITRPQSAKPEVMMTTTSLEFKRPSSASMPARSASEAPRRLRSAKPRVQRKEEPSENGTAAENDRRRISYEQWLQSKRKEDEAKRLEERKSLEDLRRSYQDSELDKIIPDLARNRIRVIESNKKRVDSGYKRADEEANSYPRPRTSTGTQGVKMYRWRPASAQANPTNEQMSKYQLRSSHTAEYGPSPYRLSTDLQATTTASKAAQQRPSSSKNRTQYAEHIWTNFSDNVWKQVNDQNGGRPNERPEPMGQADSSSGLVNEDQGFNIEGHGLVKPLGSSTPAAQSSSIKAETLLKEPAIPVPKPSPAVVDDQPPKPPQAPAKVVQTTPTKEATPVELAREPKPKSFLETIASGSEKSQAKPTVIAKPAVENGAIPKASPPTTKVETQKPTVKTEPVAEKKATVVNDKAQIEPVPVAQGTIKAPEPVPSTSKSDLPLPPSPPQETVILTQDGQFIGTRRTSILKIHNPHAPPANEQTPKKKKKSVTFGDVTTSDGGQGTTSSDSDVDRVPVTAYRGVRHSDVASQLMGGDNIFLTDLNGS